MDDVKSTCGNAALLGVLTAVAPASTYVEPTVTAVIIPEAPLSEVVNLSPLPRMVMTGGVVSGTAAAAAAAAEAEVVPEAAPEPETAARAAAAAPQFPFTLHDVVDVVEVVEDEVDGGQVYSAALVWVQGSMTVSVREAETVWFAESSAEYTTTMGEEVTFEVKLFEELGRPDMAT